MNIQEAARLIRKELMIKDEPLKALRLMEILDMPELEKEKGNSFGSVKHAFDKDLYKRVYGHGGEFDVSDAEMIEPREFTTNAGARYERYRWIVDEFEINKPKTYLDLACYVGSLVTTASSKGIEAVGVDMTKASVDLARERNKAAGLDAKFYCEDITEFDKFKADMVSAFEVLEHVVDPEEFIKHMLDLSTGWCYITTPNGPFGNGEGNEGHWEWDGVEEHTRGHLRVFTKMSLFKLMERCRCEVAFLDGMGDGLLWCKFRRKK